MQRPLESFAKVHEGEGGGLSALLCVPSWLGERLLPLCLVFSTQSRPLTERPGLQVAAPEEASANINYQVQRIASAQELVAEAFSQCVKFVGISFQVC